MDVIISAVGEFIWAASCAVINFSLTSGLSVLVIFVSFLCAILASAFYKYTTNREQMSEDSIEEDEQSTATPVTEPLLPSSPPAEPPAPFEPIDIRRCPMLSEIEIHIEENSESQQQREEEEEEANNNGVLIDNLQGSEEEIQKQQIANIFRLLNDQNLINNWSTTDFVDQLKMYGLQAYDEDELDSSQTSVE